jgi:hypothetical protein
MMCGGSTRRGGRHPVGAHAVAVDAAHRLRSGARSEVASLNSLRSLRSLHSNKRDESDDEARLRAPTSTLRSSPPQKSPPPDAARREANGSLRVVEEQPRVQQRRVGVGWGARGRRREAQGFRPRAQRASLTDSSRLFEQRERSERREFSDGPQDRASQGSRCEASTASVARPGPPQRAFAAAKKISPEFAAPTSFAIAEGA